MSKFLGWVCGLAVVIALVIWSAIAVQWMDEGCDAAEAYQAVFEHGTPEGLEALPACAG
ncbi:hypothetical protein [Streptomyces sp. MAR4 CNX-425]|uniref:hypothetical protein n=1 Tax=Streptomyces sp. MAR4 CNX-425 TaxID=3406343 RepID=UPI003B50AA76